MGLQKNSNHNTSSVTQRLYWDWHHLPTRIIASIPPPPLRERPDRKMDISMQLGSIFSHDDRKTAADGTDSRSLTGSPAWRLLDLLAVVSYTSRLVESYASTYVISDKTDAGIVCASWIYNMRGNPSRFHLQLKCCKKLSELTLSIHLPPIFNFIYACTAWFSTWSQSISSEANRDRPQSCCDIWWISSEQCVTSRIQGSYTVR